MKHDMTLGKEWKSILFFTLPLLLGNVFQQLYNTVDSVVVGNAENGDKLLAAVGTSFPIIFLVTALMMGIGMGATVLISQYFGAKDEEKLKRVVGTTYMLTFVLSVVFTIIGLIFSKNILLLLNTPSDIIVYAKQYLDIILIGIITSFGYNIVSALLRGVGDSKTSLIFIIISTVINIVLDIIFVLVLKWGVAGAAWATVTAQGASFVFSLIYLEKKSPIFKLNFKYLKVDKEILSLILKIGIPSGLQQMAVSVGMMLMQGRVNYFGSDVMAGFSAACKVDSFAIMPALNFGMAMSTFVGQNLGAKKPERIKKGLRATLIMATIFSLVIGFLLFNFGELVITWFNKTPAVVAVGSSYLKINSYCYLAGAAMFIIVGVVRGAGDSFVAMLFTICSLWLIRVPLAYILSSTALASDGIWLSQPISWIAGTIIAYLYYRTGIWMKKSQVILED